MKKNAIFIVVVALVAIAGIAAFGWAYGEIAHYRDNVEQIAQQAVEVAKEEQFVADKEAFAEAAKQPFATFAGPADFGSVSFEYPRTWSAYNSANDKNSYEVVFYPGVIPLLSNDTPVALRVSVLNTEYESELKKYESDAGKGTVTVTPITVNESEKGVRVDGNINKNFTSSRVLLKLRDKTLALQTDTNKYLGNFDDVILATLNYIP